ncbi:MAG: hypothetical protein ACD_80C00197G0002 [uncultured bacterium (gcode 4)]|uniref:non-specific serine/threonine protein kinase n=1 Tax=uncultured bacterium (gcode 4) TaxID=1234023 RepID=K1XVU9_9BACT|nr:MAG: hypothetical protein ACD_80C00197G0002 [uncultured bacterium (gcode 4)]
MFHRPGESPVGVRVEGEDTVPRSEVPVVDDTTISSDYVESEQPDLPPSVESETKKHEIPNVVNGAYENLQLLGEGGMGVAFIADRIETDHETGKTKKTKVVIKTMRLDFLAEQRKRLAQIELEESARHAIEDADTQVNVAIGEITTSDVSSEGQLAEFEYPDVEVIVDTLVDPQDKMMVSMLVNMDALQLEVRTMLNVQRDHPNPHVLKLIDDGTVELKFDSDDTQMIGIVMEYIEGQDVEHVLDTYHEQGYYDLLQGDAEKILSDQTTSVGQQDALNNLKGLYEMMKQYFDTEIMTFGLQVADGLVSIHDSDIAHRDLKPANVMKSRGSYVIFDFGIAQVLPKLIVYEDWDVLYDIDISPPLPITKRLRRPETTTESDSLADTVVDKNVVSAEKNNVVPKPGHAHRSGTITGTPQYIPPEYLIGHDMRGREILDSKEDNVARDLYALGMSLYEMKVGHRPFDDIYRKGTLKGMKAQAYDSPPPISKNPTHMDMLIQTLIAQDIAHRKIFILDETPYDISTASGVVDALTALQSSYNHSSEITFEDYIVVYKDAEHTYRDTYLNPSV